MSVICLVETQVEDTLVLMVFDCFCIDIYDMISILKLGHNHVIESQENYRVDLGVKGLSK